MTSSIAELEPSAWDEPGAARHPARCTIRPAPHREPPFDDESAGRHLSLVGAHDQPLPFTVTPPRSAAPAERTLSVAEELADPLAFGRRLVIAIIELATGRRSALHLNAHVAPSVLSGLSRDAGRIARLGTSRRPATLHSLHSTTPADGVAELAAVVRVGDRFRAIALRLEAKDARWRCVRLQIG